MEISVSPDLPAVHYMERFSNLLIHSTLHICNEDLHSKGIRLILTTGLPRIYSDLSLNHLMALQKIILADAKWCWFRIDIISVPEKPDKVLTIIL